MLDSTHGPVRADRRRRRVPHPPASALNPTDVRFAVLLTPRSGSDAVDGVVDGVLKARVAAPPIEGAANQALLRLIARELDIPRRNVRLVAGAGGRTKLIVVDGIRAETVAAHWPGLKI